MWIQINTDDETIIIPNVRRYCKVSTTVPTVPTAVTTAAQTLNAGRVSREQHLQSKLTTRSYHTRTASTTTGMQAITSGG